MTAIPQTACKYALKSMTENVYVEPGLADVSSNVQINTRGN